MALWALCFCFWMVFLCTHSFHHFLIWRPRLSATLVMRQSHVLELWWSQVGNAFVCEHWALFHLSDMSPFMKDTHPCMFWCHWAASTAVLYPGRSEKLFFFGEGSPKTLANFSSQHLRIKGEVWVNWVRVVSVVLAYSGVLIFQGKQVCGRSVLHCCSPHILGRREIVCNSVCGERNLWEANCGCI